jgi:hypothetical protein
MRGQQGALWGSPGTPDISRTTRSSRSPGEMGGHAGTAGPAAGRLVAWVVVSSDSGESLVAP